MTEEQGKKEEVKEETTKAGQGKEELSEEELSGLSGGFKLHEFKQNPTQVPMSQGLDG